MSCPKSSLSLTTRRTNILMAAFAASLSIFSSAEAQDRKLTVGVISLPLSGAFADQGKAVRRRCKVLPEAARQEGR